MPNSPTQTPPLDLSTHCHSDETTPQWRRLNSIAQDLIKDYGLERLSRERLALIVNAAQEVKHQLFIAALDDPTARDLESIAEDFIHRALAPRWSVQ